MDAEQIAAEIYDHTVGDWAAEILCYQELALKARTILEVACGTGRVGLRLAAPHRELLGIDISPHMIAIAKAKSRDVPNVDWRVADMRTLQLGRTFDLVIVPGHSFQFMLEIADQLACLRAIREHLAPGGRLVLHVEHQDLAWLGGLPAYSEGILDVPSEVRLQDGRAFRIAKRWSYNRATQTACVVTAYEEVGAGGAIIDRVQRGPVQLHCFFRYEMELLWQRAGLEVDALYGDFMKSDLGNQSTEMLWLLRAAPG